MSQDLLVLAQQFSEEDKAILAAIEQRLVFQVFDSQAALALGALLVEEAVAFGEERNIGFALRKMAAVRATGFSSLYSLALLSDNPQLLDLEHFAGCGCPSH